MIKIIIGGDFCPQNRVLDLIEKHQFENVFGELVSILRGVDFKILNLEAPVINNNIRPISKNGPILGMTSVALKSICYAGFDAVTLANNHFYDYGEEGVINTLRSCKENGLEYVGGGTNIEEAKKPLTKTIRNKRISFINLCENETSIATKLTGGSNPLDLVSNYYQIVEAKKHSDFVIVIVHGGHEGFQFPSLRMKNTYRFFIEIGADAVLNHHQHCYSGYEIYQNKPIFYGLGNLSFDKLGAQGSKWNEGYLVELLIKNEGTISFNIHNYIQGAQLPGITLRSEKEFSSKLIEINKIINDDNLLFEEFKKFNQNRLFFKLIFEPYTGKIATFLYRKGLLPSTFAKKKKDILSLIRCESHRDRLIHMLEE